MRNEVRDMDKKLMYFEHNGVDYYARECNGQVRFYNNKIDGYLSDEKQLEFLQRTYEAKVQEKLNYYIENLLFIGHCEGVNYYRFKGDRDPIYEVKGTFYELNYDGYESADYLDNKLLNEAVKKIKEKANEREQDN